MCVCVCVTQIRGLCIFRLINTDELFENICLQMLNPKRLQALEKWQKEKRIKLAQVNGQRKYGGPPDGEKAFWCC